MSVAVLPFTTLAGDSDFQAYADGLMDGITNRLSQFEGTTAQLLVVPASEVWRQQVDSASEAKGKLGADYVVEGALTAQGERVRLTLAVVDASSMRHLGSSDVEEERGKALNLQDGALARLANLLDLRISPEDVAEYGRISPASPDATAFYIQGRGYLHRSDKIDQIDLAIALFNRSLEIDPDHALAHAGLGAAYSYKYDRTNDTQWVDLSLTHCRRALELNAQLADVHVTMGRIYTETGRPTQAVAEYQEALDIEPRSAQAYSGLARAYADLGDTQKAESIFRKAVDLRREDWTIYKELGLFYYRQGRYQEAIRQFEQVAALTPDNALAYVNLGAAHYRVPNTQKAEEYWKHALMLSPDRISAITNLATLMFEQEKYKESVAYYTNALEIDRDQYRIWGNLAAAQRRSGDEVAARESCGRAIELAMKSLEVNPNDLVLQSYLAHYYGFLRLKRQFTVIATSIIQQNPVDPEVWIRLALGYADLRLDSQALESVRQASRYGYSLDALPRNQRLTELVRSSK